MTRSNNCPTPTLLREAEPAPADVLNLAAEEPVALAGRRPPSGHLVRGVLDRDGEVEALQADGPLLHAGRQPGPAQLATRNSRQRWGSNPRPQPSTPESSSLPSGTQVSHLTTRQS